MALHPLTLERTAALQDILFSVVIVIAAIAAMVIATVVFGWNGDGPTLQLTTDPLGAIPFFAP